MKNIQDLKKEEMRSVFGGESFWHRVGQGVGYLAGTVSKAINGLMEQDRDRPTSWLHK